MEYLDTPGLAAELQEIHGMYLAEIKEKKNLKKGLKAKPMTLMMRRRMRKLTLLMTHQLGLNI